MTEQTRHVILGVAVVAAMVLVPGVSSADIAIDDFTVPQFQIQADGGGATNASTVDGDGILGGERDVEIAVLSPSGVVTFGVIEGMGISELTMNNAAEGELRLSWDGDDDNPGQAGLDPTGLGGRDLTNRGRLDAFELLLSADHPYRFAVDVYTDALSASTFTRSNLPASEHRLIVPFDEFVVAAGTGADFANVGAIVVRITSMSGEPGLDAELDMLRATSSLTATMDDELVDDADGDGHAEPGDTIRYTIVIANPADEIGSAGDDATVDFGQGQDPGIDSNTSLVPGSVCVGFGCVDAGAVVTGNGSDDRDVAVHVGPLPDGEEVTVSFEVTIDPELVGVDEIVAQGVLSTTGDLVGVLTDDASDPTRGRDPTVTALVFCGNGLRESGEQCDDGGESAACNFDCTPAVCGDGVVNETADEECDTGGVDDGSCLDTCTRRAVIAGGGCAATEVGGGLALVLVLFVLAYAARRRVWLLAAIMCAAGAGEAAAQSDRNFSAERLRLALDSDGILDVESAAVIGHLGWEVGLWLGTADDPLTVYEQMDDTLQRAQPMVSQRLGGDLVGVIGLGRRFQVGVRLPLIVGQSFALDDDALAPSASVGIGDIRVAPKLQLLRAGIHGVDLAVIPALSLPTAGADSYFGESSVGIAPELAISRRFGAVRAAGNVGYQVRRNIAAMGLDIGDEVFLRLGVGYRAGRADRPLDLDLSVSVHTAASDLFGQFNRNHAELIGGVSYQASSSWNAFAGAGAGMSVGFGTPDWRALAGLRYTRRVYDRDGDGILDRHDDCPDEPEDHDRYADEDGCLDADNDRDGVLDYADGAPMDPEDVDGFEDEDGVPDRDNDADRIADVDDACPMQPETRNGYQDRDGCPEPDRDNDTVVDRLDNCPDEPGTVANFGCVNAPLVALRGGSLEMLDKVHFETDSAKILARSHELLEDVARVLRVHPDIELVRVEGHCDDRGRDGYNEGLSQRRADSVMEFLVDRGIDPARLEARGYGEARPIADNATSSGRAANRRVEFVIVKERAR